MIKKRRQRLVVVLALVGILVFWFGHKNDWLAVSPLTQLRHHENVVAVDFVEEANQKLAQTGRHMPLILQTDERWYYEAYGRESEDNYLGVNGCALAAVAMVGSYWQERLIEPVELLNWAQNDYYLPGQGTMWRIFSDYAHAIGLLSHDLGNDFATAKYYMTLGYPVLVSVKPGFFTDVGHIMVLMADEHGNTLVFDPNDSPDKRHYGQTFSDDLFLNEGINYWVYQ